MDLLLIYGEHFYGFRKVPRSFFWSAFPCVRTEYEVYGFNPYPVRKQENTDQKKLRILTLLTQCENDETKSYLNSD